MAVHSWTESEVEWAVAVLGQHTVLASACKAMSAALGRGIDSSCLTRVFRRRNMQDPVTFLSGGQLKIPLTRPAPPVARSGVLRADTPSVPARVEVTREVAPAPEPDPIERDRKKTADKRIRDEHKDLVERLKEAEARQDVLDRLGRDTPTPRIIRREHTSGLREGTAVAVASDWHVEEVVLPASVAGRNEYNLVIADRRSRAFFSGVRSLVEFSRGSWKVRDLVLMLLGDLITGFIHEELQETNELSPVEAIVWLRQRLVDGIGTLLEDTELEHIIIPCVVGNHGRTTAKRRIKTNAQNSFEWLLYQWLASHYEKEPRVTFHVGTSSHVYVDAYEKTIHMTHGDELRSWGGVGGLAIPLGKRVPKWNAVRNSHLHVMGHFHEFLDFGHSIVNGSLIGYSDFAMSIGAGFEPPQQAFCLLDSQKWKCMTAPIWVEV